MDLDDGVYIAENPTVQKGLTLEGMRWAFTTFETGNWHPLTWLSLMLDAELFNHPGGPHMVNVLLHILNTLVLFQLFKRMTGGLWCSALVAALFAFHPLHVESVAWISERKDVLSTLFGLLSITAYVRYTKEASGRKWYLIMCALLALGLMAKPMLVTIPIVLLLIDLWPLGRWEMPTTSTWFNVGWRLVREKLPLFGMVLASAIVAIIAQQSAQAVSSLEDLPVTYRFTNAVVAYVAYLVAFGWPSDLAILYPLAENGVPWWKWAGSLIVVLAISLAVWKWRRRSPYLVIGWSWYLITLLPVIGFVQVGAQSMADRYTYIPSIGIFLALAWGAADLVARYRLSVARVATVFIALLVTLGLAAWHQVQYWRNSGTMFAHTLSVTSTNPLIEFNYGVVLATEGQHEKAVAHFEKALDIMPKHFVALVDMGISQASLGKLDRAMEYYNRALAIDPRAAELRLKMSNVLGQQGKNDEAIAVLLKAVELDTTKSAVLRSNLGFLYLRQQNFASAMENLREAVRLDPRNAQAQNNLGLAYASTERYGEAIACFERALKVEPDYANARQNLELARSALDEANATTAKNPEANAR